MSAVTAAGLWRERRCHQSEMCPDTERYTGFSCSVDKLNMEFDYSDFQVWINMEKRKEYGKILASILFSKI